MKVRYYKCAKCNLTVEIGPLAEIPTKHFCGSPLVEISESEYNAVIADNTWVRHQRMDYLENEGYYETSGKVIECHSFAQWLGLARSRKANQEHQEPYQKSDLGYGLS